MKRTGTGINEAMVNSVNIRRPPLMCRGLVHYLNNLQQIPSAGGLPQISGSCKWLQIAVC